MTLTLPRFLLALALMAPFGCALSPRGVARDMAQTGPPAAINSSLRAMSEAENQRLVLQLMASPAMREAVQGFTAALADGTLNAMTEPERLARVEAMSARYVSTLTRVVTRSMAEGIRQDLAPALAVVMRETVAASLREALRETYQRDMQRVAGGLTRAAVDAAVRGVSEGITRDIAPAMRGALDDERTTAALGVTARTLARDAVLGSNDAMSQIQRAQERSGRPSFLARLGSLTEGGVKVMQLLAAGALALIVVLGLWIVRLIFKSRRVQAESERHAESAATLAQAIRDAEVMPWSGELTSILQGRLRENAAEDLIDDVLKARANTKTRRQRTRPPPPPLLHAGEP